LIVLVPLLTWWARGRIEADLNPFFIALLMATVLLQFLLLFSYDLWQARELLLQASFWQTQFPWRLLLVGWLATSGLTTLVIIGIVNILPHESRSIISLEGHRLYGR